LARLVTANPDPVLERRARIAKFVTLAQRVGYGFLLLAIVAFVAGALSDFPSGLVTVTVAALVAAIVILPVPIVLGYGVRAAEREERQQAQHREHGSS
jgi:hypothetical protein